MKSESKNCKHNVKLAFNNDEIVFSCDKCGKILDRYRRVKANGHINFYHTCPSTTPTIPSLTITCTIGDPYPPEMGGSHTSTSTLSDVTSLK